MSDQALTDERIDALDTFSLHHLAPRGRESVRAFARAVMPLLMELVRAVEREARKGEGDSHA